MHARDYSVVIEPRKRTQTSGDTLSTCYYILAQKKKKRKEIDKERGYEVCFGVKFLKKKPKQQQKKNSIKPVHFETRPYWLRENRLLPLIKSRVKCN